MEAAWKKIFYTERKCADMLCNEWIKLNAQIYEPKLDKVLESENCMKWRKARKEVNDILNTTRCWEEVGYSQDTYETKASGYLWFTECFTNAIKFDWTLQ